MTIVGVGRREEGVNDFGDIICDVVFPSPFSPKTKCQASRRSFKRRRVRKLFLATRKSC